MNYDRLLLNELRYVTYVPGDVELTDELMAKAVTLNENLITLGYKLAPMDFARIATSPSLDGFYDKIRGCLHKVGAKPMYPGFPKEVMEMDEAVFRFHQMVHYFSTYGMESIFGVSVTRGWVPHESDEDTLPKPQRKVLKAKVIALLPEKEQYSRPFREILSKRERMTIPESEIVAATLLRLDEKQILDTKILFKENMNVFYQVLFELENREKAFSLLRSICAHTGDVLRCIDVLLRLNKYHFRTSQKRFLVKLLESYPVKDFRENVILSNKRAERNILLLGHLDYSIYSKSGAHMQVVDDLRDNRLHSWESGAKAMLEKRDDDALDYLATRPGMMLRMVAWLVRLGYSSDLIFEKLNNKANDLSLQTLVTNATFFGKFTKEERPEAKVVYSIFERVIQTRMKICSTPLRNKKVFIREDDFDLDLSEIDCNNKSQEGGYFRSGLAYRLPKDIDSLRFFVYWNDKDRVDIDLHTSFKNTDGMQGCVGWNKSYNESGVVYSGDITHSNAAEYIDIDLNKPIDKVNANVHLFYGKNGFDEIETCYVGMMAVPKGNNDGRAEALYDEANCFFKHNLREHIKNINYGYIDVQNRCVFFAGEKHAYYDWYGGSKHRPHKFTLRRYLELLLIAQNATLCENEQDADVVLVMGKPETSKEVSVIDHNFFMDKIEIPAENTLAS